MRIQRWVCTLALPVALWASLDSAEAENSRKAPRRNSITRPSDLAFTRPELVVNPVSQPVEQFQGLLRNRSAWDRFLAQYGPDSRIVLDGRSGAPTSLIVSVPLIPGTGQGNSLRVHDTSRRLRREVRDISSAVVAESVLGFIKENKQVLAINTSQLGPLQASQVTGDLWHISAPQEKDGIPVRFAGLSATLRHGNLVLLGTRSWGNVQIDTHARMRPEDALNEGFAHVGGRQPSDEIWKSPTLEILPYEPVTAKSRGPRRAFAEGYRHKLVYAFGFVRHPDPATWEVLVDAQSGEVLSLQDTNEYAKKKISGAVYPRTNTGMCAIPENCGVMQPDYPMPWANTGLLPPADVTDAAGLVETESDTFATTLQGKYVTISDGCGAVSESTLTGHIALEGSNGHHDCDVPAAHSPGDTAATRTAFYEVNKVAAMARGWLPSNVWLQQPLETNVNLTGGTCNAFYSLTQHNINFFAGGDGCRNAGEIASILVHEWGHGLDRHDSNMVFSRSGEAYADIASLYRTQTSCMGQGVNQANNRGCGQSGDLLGYNADEAQMGDPHCDTDCSGWRDANWARHTPATPDTPANFVVPSCECCVAGSPCGAEKHCAAAPSNQAAWDFATRDLTAAPFNYDLHTAFIVAAKVFFQGSGNIGLWHECDDPATNGCGADSGYMNWLAADDDNGNLLDGTPHMTALYAAFNRHGIACAMPIPQDSGCSGGPTDTPVASATAGDNQVTVTWTKVPNAVRYWVFRMEGHTPAEYGKTLIGTVDASTLSFTDTEVANGRQYCYLVLAVGSSDACFTRASNPACVELPG